MTAKRSVNINEYPEHLNPFHEDDNHSKLRFWTINKKKTRSNSLSFNSIKDFKESFGRSFSIRRNKRSSKNLEPSSQSINTDFEQQKPSTPVPQSFPSQYNSIQQRVSITPLPRIRFHERVKNTESEKYLTCSDDNNPFKDDNNENIPIALEKQVAKLPRKKKRAPPPPARQSPLNMTQSVTEPTLATIKMNDQILTSDEILESIKATETSGLEDKHLCSLPLVYQSVELIKLPKICPDLRVKDTISLMSNNKIVGILEAQENNIYRHTEEYIILDSETKGTETAEIDVVADSNIKHKQKPNCTENTQIMAGHSVNKIVDWDDKLETAELEENISNLQENVNDTCKQQDNPLYYNSELKLSTSESSISSETRLERHQQQKAIDDSSDLLQLVQKLQMEVDKLTDETNNNIIMPNPLNARETNINYLGSNRLSLEPESPFKVETEANIVLEKENSSHDDDNDVMLCDSPVSSHLMRLKQDSEWIQH